MVKNATFRQSAGKNVTREHFTLKIQIVRERVGTPDQPTIEEGSEHHAM